MHLPAKRLLSLLLISACAPAQARASNALEIVRAGLAAQGGESVLRAVRSIRWHATGYRNELEQSERPEGPWIQEFDTVEQVEDLAQGRVRSVTAAKVVPFPSFAAGFVADRTAAVRLNGNSPAPGNLKLLMEAKEALALSPERLLLTALDASDLHMLPRRVIQGVPQDVVRFTLDGAPATIFVNGYTHLPTAIDYSGPLARSGYWAFVGDVKMRTYLGYWWLARNGIRLPLERTIERNGLPDATVTIDHLEIDGRVDEGELTISKDLRQRFDASPSAGSLDAIPLGDPSQPPVEIARGITLMPGRWNITFVRQEDGVVIIEAPISSGYSAKALDEVKRRYPGEPIKAVVTTSDSWPHIAGIREYVARGIPIYCLDANKPVLLRTAAASHSVNPDLQEREKRLPRLHELAQHLTIGTGANRMELYPIRGETSERQLMVWFPEHKLLYGSDPFQRDNSGHYFFPQTVDELRSAAERNGLSPSTFFMMHMGPTPWADLEQVHFGAAQEQSMGEI